MLRAPMDVAAWFDSPWEILAWIGQACFFVRFLVQWIASERAGESVAPAGVQPLYVRRPDAELARDAQARAALKER